MRKVRHLLEFVAIVAVLVCILLKFKVATSYERDMVLADDYTITQPIKLLQNKEVVCDLSMLRYVIDIMVKDGYELQYLTKDKDLLDFLLIGESTYRLHYTRDGVLHIICSDFEKSQRILAYIIKK